MLLVFGGTTEGRRAVDVLEEAGKTFYYSTKTGEQEMTLHNGVRIDGAMDGEAMCRFCQEHEIRLIVDAAHPFASTLHETIATVGRSLNLPVIRYERTYPPREPDITWIDDYSQIPTDIHTLLATSGVQSIGKLQWLEKKGVKVIYRILNRESSIELAHRQGAQDEQLCFYEDGTRIDVPADAILLKESGISGGFTEKVTAARSMSMRIIALKRPPLPSYFLLHPSSVVNGPHGFRRMVENVLPDFFPLKTGLTTGAYATAAVRAAVQSLLSEQESANSDNSYDSDVTFALPDGELITVPVHIERPGVASATKGFSDDPDVTRGCVITAEVRLTDTADIRFLQGTGVGTVTLPGLGLPVGEPAINPTPRRMIEATIRELTHRGCDVTISVKGGEELAQHTFNERVGVVGGISIIGTSGIVRPMSNEAVVESIRRELDVVAATGFAAAGLAMGKRGEDELIRREPGLRVVLCGNFIGEALTAAYERGFRRCVIGIGIGKAVKLAEGHLDTHSHKVTMNKAFVTTVAEEVVADVNLERLTMARELWAIMPEAFFEKIKTLCIQHCRRVFPTGELEVVLVKN